MVNRKSTVESLVMNKAFWQGKKVLVTGHTGFKGSWLSLWLQSLQAEVIGFALPPPTTPSLFIAANLSQHMTSIVGDIRDADFLQATINTYHPDIIIHMAAQSLVLPSYEHPIDTYTTNVMGTLFLLEAARQSNCVRVIVNVTSDKCYENSGAHAYHENDPLGGLDPYSSSKACAELITHSYRHAFFNNATLRLASVRAGNVIGGGDWATHRLIPDIIRACAHQQTLQVRHPQAIRPWQHVLAPLHGYLILAEKLYEAPQGFSEAWNFGPNNDDNKSVDWIVNYICNLWGYTPEQLINPNVLVNETPHLTLNCSKANAKLQWKQYWNIEKSLQETVKWYQAFYHGENMHDYTLDQIKAYEKV